MKEWLYNEKLMGLNIKSMHLLFRPSQTPNPADRKVGLFKGQFDQAMVDEIKLITQAEIVWFENAEEHDREMAVQQALTHRTLLVLGKFLEQCNGSTFISKRVIELTERIKKGDLSLYKRIQENKYLPEKLAELKEKFEKFDIEKLWRAGRAV